MEYAASTEAQFIARVRELTGIDEDQAARRAARAVTSVMLEQFSTHDRAWLAECLPRGVGISAGPPRSAEAVQDLYERVAAREGVELGFAVEHTQSVSRALSECLSDEARMHVTQLLPSAVADLFELRDQEHAPSAAVHGEPHRARRTLSEGHPTSERPLSQSHPHEAQSDSVAQSRNPHADTKLSSSAGATQEREHETLAEARRRSRR
jgi:uncharacterized protein (DUF2267 family)